MRNLYDNLINRKEKVSFHMPGHKGKKLEGMNDFLDNILKIDVTELSDTDDLYHANNIIAEGRNNLALFSHAKSSMYLVNGSTSGIVASIMSVLDENDKILVEKNCHKSVINGVRLARGESVEIDCDGVCEQEVLIENLKKDSSIKAVLITRPNYYGIYQPIEKLVTYCHENNIKIIVDEAHGTHFALNWFDKNAMQLGCDISINSFHKTMPAFTQTAAINFNCEDELIDKTISNLQMIMTSSPSYIFMTSVEYAIDYCIKNEKKYSELKEIIDWFYREIDCLDFIRKAPIQKNCKRDFTRIVLECDNPSDVNEHLMKNGIYIEMIDDKNLVLISTIADEKKDFEILLEAFRSYEKSDSTKIYKTYDYLLNKKITNDIVIYPPGKIFAKKNSTINQEQIDELNDLSSKGVNILLK
ncbi:MAG: aminotransferase class V-fold PLP-dependent enzyme [Finegoldia magna]|uniref:Aminotransferase class V-fold PLP-dependent enzyme n=1 Tax=Finegoldia magna TaxID=1260 RepID=A0A233UY98_FINMA|nr:aminotransferase class V-fold PLP-dependent enzyme [Finegoldia magna]MBS5965479.1 aminotransferase class V-fold PLP-dependent enzyme [Finegoldia magna]MDU1580210.1 aminotransferase class V-fold PLP-dependent enzyme [Finegoldia magna]MDU1601131.1 aminotransferase class V-fold PLP-dependent enzyme [Finegoldia magna]MDU5368660.1 aminotransferase class V-fold PLP-dependent enzyme [Finegoldia magna]MDU5444425.1 aminotransferase class V-fold PLP-dependent enzyme [Finegoldia magna]